MARTVKAVVPPDDERFIVKLPFDVKAEWGQARPPITIKVGDYSFPWTVAVYDGESFIAFRKSHREAAGLEPGQKVMITIEKDETPRTVDAPPALVKAFKTNKAAKKAWDALSFSHKREHAEAILGAKKPETAERRVAKAIEMLTKPK